MFNVSVEVEVASIVDVLRSISVTKVRVECVELGSREVVAVVVVVVAAAVVAVAVVVVAAVFVVVVVAVVVAVVAPGKTWQHVAPSLRYPKGIKERQRRGDLQGRLPHCFAARNDGIRGRGSSTPETASLRRHQK